MTDTTNTTNTATTKQAPHPDSTATQKLVIIGAGMAGTRFAFALAERTSCYDITLLNAEPYAGYNRIMLSPTLAGEKNFEDITLYPEAEYAQHNIDLKTDCIATKVDTEKKQVHLNSYSSTETVLHYDTLVFATGSNPFILPLPHHDANGVLAFRTKADVDAMLNIAENQNSQCVIIGGGLLGLEAANALNNRGAHVTVVNTADYILNRQLDKTSADMLQQHFENKGINFKLQASSDAIDVDGNNNVTGLSFKDGSRIDADCIIMTVGVRPNCELANDAGIACEKGILVDAYMQTQTPDVYAIGECVQFDGNLFGLVAPVYEQADVLVKTLTRSNTNTNANANANANEQQAAFTVKSTATKLKVSGVDLFSAGNIVVTENQETLVYNDTAQGIYKKLIIENDHLVAAVLYGDVTDGAWFFELIQQQTNISEMRQDLLFGKAFCE